MATHQADIFAMLQERNRRALLHPQVTLEDFKSDLLHASASAPDILKVHLEKLATFDKSQRLALLKGKNNRGNTVLHASVLYPLCLKLVLAACPEEEQKGAVQEQNLALETALHLAVANSKSLQMILDLYSLEEQREVIQTKTAQGDTALHLAVPHIESFHMILAIYPPDKQLLALQQTNNDGLSVLHMALAYPKTLKAILNSYPQAIWILHPKNKRPAEKDATGKTVWHRSVHRPDVLEMLLQALPESERVRAVQAKRLGHNLLNWAQYNPNALKIIFRSLPESARLPLLLERGPTGSNILERIVTISNLSSLAAILESFPEAANWVADADGKMRLLPPFDTASNAAKLMQQMLVLHDQIKQLKHCGMQLFYDSSVSQPTIALAESLNASLKQFIRAKTDCNVQAAAVAQKEFCNNLSQGYKDMRTRNELIGALLLNIAMAASIVGLPFVLGKLFSTGSGFFMQTERQCKLSVIRDAFHTLEKNDDFATALSAPCCGGGK